jgi:hypothetical protein
MSFLISQNHFHPQRFAIGKSQEDVQFWFHRIFLSRFIFHSLIESNRGASREGLVYALHFACVAATACAARAPRQNKAVWNKFVDVCKFCSAGYRTAGPQEKRALLDEKILDFASESNFSKDY